MMEYATAIFSDVRIAAGAIILMYFGVIAFFRWYFSTKSS